MYERPLAVASHPDGNRLHSSTAVGTAVSARPVEVAAPETAGAVIAVRRAPHGSGHHSATLGAAEARLGVVRTMTRTPARTAPGGAGSRHDHAHVSFGRRSARPNDGETQNCAWSRARDNRGVTGHQSAPMVRRRYRETSARASVRRRGATSGGLGSGAVQSAEHLGRCAGVRGHRVFRVVGESDGAESSRCSASIQGPSSGRVPKSRAPAVLRCAPGGLSS